MSTFLSTILRGLVHVEGNGVPTPDRPTVNFIGLVVADNPTKNRVDVSVVGDVLPNAYTYVLRNGTGGIEVYDLTVDGPSTLTGLVTVPTVNVTTFLTVEAAEFTNSVLFDNGFEAQGPIRCSDVIYNYNSTSLTQGFMRWEPAGAVGIWATRFNSTHAKVLDFDATTGACTLGDDVNSTFADMRAGTSGEVRHYIAGTLKFRMTATGVGYFGATPVRPALSGSCAGNAGAFSVGSALIALGLATNGGTFTA